MGINHGRIRQPALSGSKRLYATEEAAPRWSGAAGKEKDGKDSKITPRNRFVFVVSSLTGICAGWLFLCFLHLRDAANELLEEQTDFSNNHLADSDIRGETD